LGKRSAIRRKNGRVPYYETMIPFAQERKGICLKDKESEVGIRKEIRTETEDVEVPVQQEAVIVELTPVEETWTSVADEEAFREEEIRIPVKEQEVEVTASRGFHSCVLPGVPP